VGKKSRGGMVSMGNRWSLSAQYRNPETVGLFVEFEDRWNFVVGQQMGINLDGQPSVQG
jgi:hypothetical protein